MSRPREFLGATSGVQAPAGGSKSRRSALIVIVPAGDPHTGHSRGDDPHLGPPWPSLTRTDDENGCANSESTDSAVSQPEHWLKSPHGPPSSRQ